MSAQVHPVLRYIVDRAIVVALVVLAFNVVMHRIAPPPAPVHAPVAVFTPSPLEHEVAAVEKSQQTLAEQFAGVVSILQRPGATVIHDVTGIPVSTAAHVLEATKAPTVEKVVVSVQGPTPAPVPSDDFGKKVFDAAYAADTHAIRDTQLNVNITRQEVAPSRFGSAFTTAGDGLDFTVWQRKQLALNLAAIVHGGHLSPAACASYLIPHTRLEPGICGAYVGGAFRLGVGASEKF